MANNVPNLSVPGTITNPKTGERGFDHDQLKVWMVNVGNNIIATNTSSNVTSAQLAAVSAVANDAEELAFTANVHANLAYNQANGAFTTANTANATAFEAILIAEEALHQIGSNAQANLVAVYYEGNLVIANANVNFNDSGTVNGNVTIGNTANLIQANIQFVANGTAIVGPTAQTANTALFNANLAYGQANSAANTVAVLVDGSLILAAGELNFNHSGTINVSATANGTGQTNVSFAANDTALGIPAIQAALGVTNTAIINIESALAATNAAVANIYSTANAAANTVAVFHNGALVLANVNLNFNDTATVNVAVNANGTIQTNVEFTVNTGNVLADVLSANTGNVSITYNSNGTISLDTASAGGSGGAPAGSNNQIQYNANGAFGANANLFFDVANSCLVVENANGGGFNFPGLIIRDMSPSTGEASPFVGFYNQNIPLGYVGYLNPGSAGLTFQDQSGNDSWIINADGGDIHYLVNGARHRFLKGAPGGFDQDTFTVEANGSCTIHFGLDTSGSAHGLFTGLQTIIESTGYQGVVQLSGGSANVASTVVDANSRIYLTAQDSGGGTPGHLYVSSRNPGSNFIITSVSAGDTSNVAWHIIEGK